MVLEGFDLEILQSYREVPLIRFEYDLKYIIMNILSF